MLRWIVRAIRWFGDELETFDNYLHFWGVELFLVVIAVPFTAIASGVNLTPRWRQSDNAFWWLTGALFVFDVTGILIISLAPTAQKWRPPFTREARMRMIVFHTVFNLLVYLLFFFFGGNPV